MQNRTSSRPSESLLPQSHRAIAKETLLLAVKLTAPPKGGTNAPPAGSGSPGPGKTTWIAIAVALFFALTSTLLAGAVLLLVFMRIEDPAPESQREVEPQQRVADQNDNGKDHEEEKVLVDGPNPPYAPKKDDFKFAIQLDHTTLGDLKEKPWLIDGSKVSGEVVRADDHDKEAKDTWLKDHPPKITIQWGDVTNKENEHTFSYKDIEPLAKGNKETVDLKITAQLEDMEPFEETLALTVPCVRVRLERVDLHRLLEPDFFGGKDRKLYTLDEGTSSLLNQLGELETDSPFYSHGNSNYLNSKVRVFGNELNEEQRSLKSLLGHNEYSQGMNKAFAELKASRELRPPLNQMLEAIENHAKKEDAVDVMKAMQAIDLLNDLFVAQAESYKANNPIAWAKPMEIARALSELLSEPIEYNPTVQPAIAAFAQLWGQTQTQKLDLKAGLNLKERWESFYRRKQELVRAMDRVEGRSFYDLEVKSDKEQPGQEVFTLPVIVEVVKDGEAASDSDTARPSSSETLSSPPSSSLARPID